MEKKERRIYPFSHGRQQPPLGYKTRCVCVRERVLVVKREGWEGWGRMEDSLDLNYVDQTLR